MDNFQHGEWLAYLSRDGKNEPRSVLCLSRNRTMEHDQNKEWAGYLNKDGNNISISA